MKKSYLLLCLFFIALTSLNAQRLERQSLSILGSTQYADGVVLRQTMGQPSNTTTVNAQGSVLRQGFQQPFSSNGVSTLASHQVSLLAYPNPASHNFTIQIEGEAEDYFMQIRDVKGIVLTNAYIKSGETNYVDCRDWVSGTYVISLYWQDTPVKYLQIVIIR